MPTNKESEIVSNKEAQKENVDTAKQTAQVQADADKAQAEKSKKLDDKFGSDGTASDRQKTEQRMKDISKMLRESIKKSDDAKKDLNDFSAALQEKRADLPDKNKLTVEEFNDWLNDLNTILDERDRAAQSSEDTLRYVIEKIRTDSK